MYSTYTTKNNDVKIDFSSKGGNISHVLLKEYLTYHKKPLIILDDKSSSTSLLIGTAGNTIDLKELYYKVLQTKKADTIILEYALDLGAGKSVHQTYFFPPAGFEVGYEIRLKGLDAYLQSDPVFRWENKMKNLEHGISDSRIRATLNYYTANGNFDGFSERSTDLEEENLPATKWISFKQHFFTSAIIAKRQFNSAYVSISVDEADTSTVKTGIATLKVPASDVADGARFSYYFGPNNYQILKKVTNGFDKNIYLGFLPINLVNKYLIIPIFNFLENYISNYGIIIIILVLIIKILLSPLSYKSYLSMAKTKVLKPELDEIKKQFPDDTQKQQQEQMKLYQQVGVNPLSGCIPMLLQMPILFSMFYFFPSSIELRQESFLWADDLSTYDSIMSLPFTIPFYGDHVSLFVILMTASTILYTWSNNQMTSMQGPMKSMMYMMPVIFMFVLNSFPAALSFYYFISNIITFGQQALIKKFVDEDKIKAVLDENRLRNRDKKKSKFQLKLEQAMKVSKDTSKKKRR
ncbi:MAG: membrane protein insertase YidC [Bacteroidetes bacterium]|nr:membrane protein insertase YidC [Bacteroidota bacterium]